jgi:hypothetical protein
VHRRHSSESSPIVEAHCPNGTLAHMIDKLAAAARRINSRRVIFSLTGAIFVLSWYDMMVGPTGGAA